MPRDRYATDGSIESAHQLSSDGRVLANLAGITVALHVGQVPSLLISGHCT